MFKFKNQKGFTLIEVLLVVVILGVLAAIAIPRFMTSEAEAKENACASNVSLIRTQIEQYHFKEGTTDVPYPAVLADFLADTDYFPNGASGKCLVTGLDADVLTYDATAGTLACPNGHGDI